MAKFSAIFPQFDFAQEISLHCVFPSLLQTQIVHGPDFQDSFALYITPPKLQKASICWFSTMTNYTCYYGIRERIQIVIDIYSIHIQYTYRSRTIHTIMGRGNILPGHTGQHCPFKWAGFSHETVGHFCVKQFISPSLQRHDEQSDFDQRDPWLKAIPSLTQCFCVIESERRVESGQVAQHWPSSFTGFVQGIGGHCFVWHNTWPIWQVHLIKKTIFSAFSILDLCEGLR